jgi:protoporphyrinogen oxidase
MPMMWTFPTKNSLNVPEFREKFNVGILGAGVAGLYIALMIDSLGPKSGITYEILEADTRCGGRLYTHKFAVYTPDDYYVGPLL